MSQSAESNRVWNDACGHLQGVLSRDVYERWISPIQFQETRDNQLFLAVANDFYQSWLEENYLTLIEDAVASVSGVRHEVNLSVDTSLPTSGSRTQEKPQPKKGHKKKTTECPSVLLNARYTFESFVVGPSNSFAHAAALAVAHSPAKAYNPLFIYGGSGLGKTHLMQAIGHVILKKLGGSVCYVSSETMMNEYIDALQKQKLVAFRRKYRNTDILLIDDIHFLAGKERLQEEFFHTFNALFDGHKQIVLTCDRPASEIPGLEHRLVSRFEWGLVTNLESPDVETRIAILRKKRDQLNVNVGDDILIFIAERIRSNVRRLEGALIRAASYSSLTGQSLGIERLEYLLRDTLDQEQSEVMTVEKIQRVVAEFYDLRLSDMTSRSRPKNVALPRQIAMYLSRSKTDYSLPVIGNAFGRNHATVLHAFRKIGERMKNDVDLRRTVTSISNKLDR